jgi:hypothetical protein
MTSLRSLKTGIAQAKWVPQNSEQPTQIMDANGLPAASNQRAIYLGLNLSIKHDSLVTEVPAKILFDYKRGELYVTCSDPLWRQGEWEVYRGNTAWMNEAELHSIVEAIGK